MGQWGRGNGYEDGVIRGGAIWMGKRGWGNGDGAFELEQWGRGNGDGPMGVEQLGWGNGYGKVGVVPLVVDFGRGGRSIWARVLVRDPT